MIYVVIMTIVCALHFGLNRIKKKHHDDFMNNTEQSMEKMKHSLNKDLIGRGYKQQ